MNRLVWLLLLIGLAFPGRPVRAEDPPLQSAGAAYAPLQVMANAPDPATPLTRSQRNELVSEFKGLVHMGLNDVPYEKWEGREMADCDRPQSPSDRWTYRCEIITGQGNGFYYFYLNKSRSASILQELDIQMQASDPRLVDDMRRPIEGFFGRSSLVERTTVPAKPVGPIRHWTSGTDRAELFMDRSVRPQGSVRFVWTRSESAD